MLDVYERWVQKALDRPREVCRAFVVFLCSALRSCRSLGSRFFRARTPANSSSTSKLPPARAWKSPNDYIKQVEEIVRQIVKPADLNTIVSNIGVMADLSALFTPNSGMHTAFVQVGLKKIISVSSFVYMERGARAHLRQTAPAVAHLLSVRRPGGCGAESRHARAH